MTTCQHRFGDCEDVAPGISQCKCGQLFAFVSMGGWGGRWKKVEELTDKDKQSFDQAMAEELRAFMGRKVVQE